jgi:hypothetical protein
LSDEKDGIEYGADWSDATAAADGGPDFEAMLAAELAERGGSRRDADDVDGDGEADTDPDHDQDLSDGSEGDDDPGDGGDQDQEDGAHPDDSGDDDDDDVQDDGKKASSDARHPRLVRRLQESERQVRELTQKLKELEAAPPQSARRQRTGDLLDETIGLICEELDCKADDPRVREALQRLGGDVVAELAGDVDDPNIRSRRERRESERRQREVQRQIDELRTEKAQQAQELRTQQAIAAVSTGLRNIGSEQEYPYLHAAEADASRAVWDGLTYLMRTQGLTINGDAEAEDAIAYVARTINDHHRETAERLSKVGAKKAPAGAADGKTAKSGRKSESLPNSESGTTRGSRKGGTADGNRRKGNGDRTVTASGVGGRARPTPPTETNPKDLFESLLREELSTRRRSAAQRNRTR